MKRRVRKNRQRAVQAHCKPICCAVHGGSLTPAMLVDTCRDPQGAGNWDQSPHQRRRSKAGRERHSGRQPGRTRTLPGSVPAKNRKAAGGLEDGLRAYHHSSSAPASLPSDPPSSGTTGEKTLSAE